MQYRREWKIYMMHIFPHSLVYFIGLCGKYKNKLICKHLCTSYILDINSIWSIDFVRIEPVYFVVSFKIPKSKWTTSSGNIPNKNDLVTQIYYCRNFLDDNERHHTPLVKFQITFNCKTSWSWMPRRPFPTKHYSLHLLLPAINLIYLT